MNSNVDENIKSNTAWLNTWGDMVQRQTHRILTGRFPVRCEFKLCQGSCCLFEK